MVLYEEASGFEAPHPAVPESQAHVYILASCLAPEKFYKGR